MKRIRMTVAAAFAVGTLLAETAPLRLDSKTEIVIDAKAGKAVRFAAEELQFFLSRALDAEIPVANRPTAGRTPVYLGSNVWTCAAGLAPWKLPRDSFAVGCDGQAVYIAGTDDPGEHPELNCFLGDESLWQQQYERGTLFGVYEFLERYAGVRMYFPGELGTIIPKTGAIEVPEVSFERTPDYSVRRWGYDDGSVPESLLEGCGTSVDFKRLHFMRLRGETTYIPCCHGQNEFALAERFRKTHPEYFVMTKDGRRWTDFGGDPNHDGQLCQSSGIWDEMFLDIRSRFRGEPASVRGVPAKDGRGFAWGRNFLGKYVDVMPQDGMCACHCPVCQAAYSKTDPIDYATELVWTKTAQLGERLKAEGIDCRLTLEAYVPYGRLPGPEIRLPDNVEVQVSRAGPWSKCNPETLRRHNEEIAGWAKKVGHKVWVWVYPDKVSCFNVEMPDVPQMTPHAWGEYFKALKDSIVGGFAESESDRWLYNYLNYYVYSRVCWDTSVDIEAVLEEHYRLMFGRGASFMRKFFESLERKWIDEIVFDVTDSPLGPAVAKAPCEKDVWTKVFAPAVLAEYARLLDAAEDAVAPGSLEARRVQLFRREFLVPMQTHARRFAAADARGKLKVGYYVGRGGRGNWAMGWLKYLSHSPDIELVLLEGEDVRAGKLEGLDLLAMPGGRSAWQAESLGEEGMERIREYLRKGGRYYGTCAGCSLVQDVPGLMRIIPFAKTSKIRRGTTEIPVEFTESAERQTGIAKGVHNVAYYSGPLIQPTDPKNVPDCHDIEVLATFAGSIAQTGPREPFPMQGYPAYIAAGYGKGKVFVTATHPEYHPSTADIIAGGIRFLTGRDVAFDFPRKPKGALRVGYFSPGIMGKASMEPALALDALPKVDFRRIDDEDVGHGEFEHLDILILPEGDIPLLAEYMTVEIRGQIRKFAENGGRVLAWGRAARYLPSVGAKAFGTAAEVIDAVVQASL